MLTKKEMQSEEMLSRVEKILRIKEKTLTLRMADMVKGKP